MTPAALFLDFLKMRRRRMSPAGRARSRKVPVRRIPWHYPSAVERTYQAFIAGIVRRFAGLYGPLLQDRYTAWLSERSGRTDAEMRRDGFQDEWGRMMDDLRGLQEELFKAGKATNTAAIMEFGRDAEEYNAEQFQRIITDVLGEQFLTDEPWLQATLDEWTAENFELIQSLTDDNIRKVNSLVRNSLQRGVLWADVAREVRKLDENMSRWRAQLIARDQIGKLNAALTKSRMESIGVTAYEWSTSGDERVRGNPEGKFPKAVPSHFEMDGVLCQWEDRSTMSTDGGKTWIPRTGLMPVAHPGEEILCRCSALPYFLDLFEQADHALGDAL